MKEQRTLISLGKKREGTTLNQTAYGFAHKAAITREDKIHDQLKMVGRKAGGTIRSSAPKNQKWGIMNICGLVLIMSTMLFHPCGDECKKVKNPKPVDSWMEVVLAETYTVKILQGSIVDSNDRPISDALIEIINVSEDGEGKIIYVCKTKKKVNFTLRN